MGALVPQPPPPSVLPPTWERDAQGHLHYLRPWPWLCLHCHTVQSADRTDCRNCGAPKPPLNMEAKP